VPIGIEVVTVQKNGDSKKVLRHVCYCRGHGFDYETKAHDRPIRPHAQCQTSFGPSINSAEMFAHGLPVDQKSRY
jgi:hypothetical protein